MNFTSWSPWVWNHCPFVTQQKEQVIVLAFLWDGEIKTYRGKMLAVPWWRDSTAVKPAENVTIFPWKNYTFLWKKFLPHTRHCFFRDRSTPLYISKISVRNGIFGTVEVLYPTRRIITTIKQNQIMFCCYLPVKLVMFNARPVHCKNLSSSDLSLIFMYLDCCQFPGFKKSLRFNRVVRVIIRGCC